ncbi:MAG TPA: hypothetical protein VIL47_06430 [Candidatus Bipolaricaulota bacterium]
MARNVTHLAIVLLCLAFAGSGVALAQEAQLIVEVTTDKALYQPGEVVTVTVRTFVNGEPAPVTIASAQVTVTLPNGKTVYSDIRPDFHRVSPGVYRAVGQVNAPGVRQVDVVASIEQKVGCKCQVKVIKSQGVTAYAVESLPLSVAISADPLAPSVCDPITVKVTLNRAAFVRLLAVYPHGVQRELVVPGWLEAGEHWIKIQPREFFDVGPLTFKAIASDGYGLSAEAAVELLLGYGVCDC